MQPPGVNTWRNMVLSRVNHVWEAAHQNGCALQVLALQSPMQHIRMALPLPMQHIRMPVHRRCSHYHCQCSTSEWLCIAGARTTIANAAYSFLHPWTQKGNMAVRLKKLHESAQARYEKSRDGLVTSVAQQQPVLTGQLPSTSSSIPHM